MPPRAHEFQSNSLTIRYLEWGNATRPTVLLVHGSADHAQSWSRIASVLAEDFHVLAINMRGHGDSDWSPDGAYSMTDYATDLHAMTVALGLSDLRIVGHSLGGAVSIRFTGLFPSMVKRLCAIEGLRPRSTPKEPLIERVAEFIEKRNDPKTLSQRPLRSVEHATERMLQVNPRLGHELAAELAVHAVRPGPGGEGQLIWKFDPRIRKPMPIDLSDDDLAALYDRIECPVLLTCGAESWAVNPSTDGRADLFKHAQVIEYPGAGHWLHHDARDQLIGDLQRFFA